MHGWQLSRLRANLGNILLRQGSHAAAIREYQLATDQVPAADVLLKARLLHNIGVAFLGSRMMQVRPSKPCTRLAQMQAIAARLSLQRCQISRHGPDTGTRTHMHKHKHKHLTWVKGPEKTRAARCCSAMPASLIADGATCS